MHPTSSAFVRATERATVLGFLVGVALTSLVWFAAEVLLGGAA